MISAHRSMSLCRALAQDFSSSTRARGNEYAAANRVRMVSASEIAVEARVRGTSTYRVEISREDENDLTTFSAACECPYAIDELTPCKHIWATLNIADIHGHLGDASHLNKHNCTLALFGDDSFPRGTVDEDEDAVEDDAPPVQAPGARPARRPAAPPTFDPGAHFLSSLSGALQTIETSAASYRYANAELMYVFDVEATLAQPNGLALKLMHRTPKKAGGWSRPKTAPISAPDLLFATDADRLLLAPLIGANRVYGAGNSWAYYAPAQQHSTFTLADALARDLVPAIARSERAHVRLIDEGAPICPVAWDDGPAWRLRVGVEHTSRGVRLTGHFERPGERLAIADPVLVASAGLLFTRQSIARLEITVTFALIAALRTSGEVTIKEAHLGTLAHTLARAGVPAADLPEDLHVTALDVAPTPRAHLSPIATRPYHADVTVEVSFDYDGAIVSAGAAPTMFDETRRRLVHRRLHEEKAHLAHLHAAGVRVGWDAYEREPRMEISARDVRRVVSALITSGWHVEASGRRYRAAGTVSLSVSSGIDWFDLDATVAFDDQVLPLADALAALRRGQHTVTLGDGSTGLLPDDWLARYLPLADSADDHDGRLRFRRSQTTLLDALLDDVSANAAVALDEGFTRARAELADATRIAAIDPPASFRGRLRDYQADGVGWMTFLQRVGWGGCLADDMGLGKTVMVLALLESRRVRSRAAGEPRSSLVIVPRSLVPNWIAEAARFTPDLRVVDYSHAGRRDAEAEFAAADVVLITYGTLRQDAVRLKDVEFDYIILDEAQAIKNAATISAKSARLLRGRHRLALSGTPIENHLGELWSLFEFLNPGLLGGSALFQRATRSADGDGVRPLLARALRPFILRRTKAQVAKELPARTEQTITCELSARERTLYDGLRKHFRRSVLDRVERVGMKQSQMHILEALLRLRQAACHSGLVDKTRIAESSAKLDVLLPRLTEIIEEGHKALVFSQFTSLLAIVRARLDEAGVPYEYLDGKTKNRAARVEHFQSSPDCRLFLISLKAGGLGLNLTAAEYVFLLDPWWNPAVEAQAIDRAHRIGQTREVFAYRVIAKDTVEEKILTLQKTKRDLADAILSEGATSLRHLQREDLELLLS